jgi:hypothetical protein
VADGPWLEGGERIKIEGLRDLVKDLRKLDENLPKEIRRINFEAAQEVAGAARSLVPHRSGRLEGSIRPLATQRGGQVAAGTAAVPYAGPIHFGWLRRHITPQPFLYSALDGMRDKVFEAYLIQIEKLLDDVTNTGG